LSVNEASHTLKAFLLLGPEPNFNIVRGVDVGVRKVRGDLLPWRPGIEIRDAATGTSHQSPAGVGEQLCRALLAAQRARTGLRLGGGFCCDRSSDGERVHEGLSSVELRRKASPM
jgi:hypothetical protein